jgi:hypothetical protein
METQSSCHSGWLRVGETRFLIAESIPILGYADWSWLTSISGKLLINLCRFSRYSCIKWHAPQQPRIQR